jgi:hypothetical protein
MARDERKKPNLSPEAREKLSRLAKERHAEGKLGGVGFGKRGGRPKKQRIGSRVAEAAQDDPTANYITQVFKDAIHPNQPISIRLKAAEAWIGVEREETKISLQEVEHQSKQHSREELLEMLTSKLTGDNPTATMIQSQLAAQNGSEEEVPDAEVVEEGEAA